MPNPYFRFKQFTVYHDRCAMKVGTDGVLLGAWAGAGMAKHVLDVGTGTGLIAMMIAQRNAQAAVDAIDIDSDAVGQAKDNVAGSPFGERIKCYNVSLQEFAANRIKKYDLIVSNPPFFAQSLKSPDRTRSMARHSDSLSAGELLSVSSCLLSEGGRLSVIYPATYEEVLNECAEKNKLYAVRKTYVYPTPKSPVKRILMEFSKNLSSCVESELVIEKERHVYTDEFTDLVKEFYLNM